MPYAVILNKRNTSTNYTLECTDGLLTDFLAVPSGTSTKTEHERSWTINKSTSNGKIRIELEFHSTTGSLLWMDVLQESLPGLGLPITGGFHNIGGMLELGTYDLIAPDQDTSDTYPRYYIVLGTATPSGIMTDIHTFNWGLEVQSSTHDALSSWRAINGTARCDYYGAPLVLINTLGDGIFGNFYATNEYSQGEGWCNIHIYFEFASSVNTTNWAETDLTAGSKNFKPTASRTREDIPGTGGRPPGGNKIPGYSGDVITQPGAPDETKASAVGSGLIRAYDITEANLVNVGKCLYSSTLLTALSNIFVNPLDAIISLNIFPYTPNISSSEYVKLLNHQCTLTDLGAEASGYPLTSQFRTIDFGTVSVDENWGNFLDYSQTSIELYLPFIGSVELDVSECMNGTVNVQYTIDFFTGMCVANVLCEKTFPAPSGLNVSSRSQHSYQGNCAIQLPLTAVDYGSMIGSLIGSCATGLTNPAGGVQKAFGEAVNGGWTPRVTTKGNIVANAGFCSVLYPYIRLTRPITAEPDSYQDVMGYPSYINTSLGQCSDLCVCDDIDLHTITGATPNELARIKQYCQNGVHV